MQYVDSLVGSRSVSLLVHIYQMHLCSYNIHKAMLDSSIYICVIAYLEVGNFKRCPWIIFNVLEVFGLRVLLLKHYLFQYYILKLFLLINFTEIQHFLAY